MFKRTINNSNITLINDDYTKIDSEIDLICTSPPYNIGSKSPKKLTNRRKGGYDSKSWGSIDGYPDTLEEGDYQESQIRFLNWCYHHTSGAIAYNHKDRHQKGSLICPESWILNSSLNIYDKIVWDRKSTHNHNKQYVYQNHEYIYILGNKPFFKNERLGSVWSIPKSPSNGHCAPFPIELARRLIRLYCPKGGTVCDPYSGSGSTMIAAVLENRNFIGAERETKYFNLSQERLYDSLHLLSM